MFSRAKNKTTAKVGGETGRPASGRQKGGSVFPTLIGVGAVINGDVICDGELQIDGMIEGNVDSPRVTIGQEGGVNGNVSSEYVLVHGLVNGQIESDHVIVTNSGRVTGDVVHRHLSIEDGGFLEGHCRHRDTVEKQDLEALPTLVQSA